jgi:hypothetical protein
MVATPATPTPVSPVGVGATTTPTYTWNAVTGAATYNVNLWDPTARTQTVTTVTAAAALCPNGTGTCSTTQSPALTGTTYYWYINASNAAGTSLWSNPTNFSP